MPVKIKLKKGSFVNSDWEATVIESDDPYIPVGSIVRNDVPMPGGIGNGRVGHVKQMTVNGGQPFGVDISKQGGDEIEFTRRRPQMHP